MKVLIDMNLSPEWAPFLSGRYIEAIHWSELGAPDATDRVIMACARASDCIGLTQDLDFGAILAVTGAMKPRSSRSGQTTSRQRSLAIRSSLRLLRSKPSLPPVPW